MVIVTLASSEIEPVCPYTACTAAREIRTVVHGHSHKGPGVDSVAGDEVAASAGLVFLEVLAPYRFPHYGLLVLENAEFCQQSAEALVEIVVARAVIGLDDVTIIFIA